MDFFTPIVDDPYMFGQIAAANSLSDVWAMGGEPAVALNIVGFPNCLDPAILGDILAGGCLLYTSTRLNSCENTKSRDSEYRISALSMLQWLKHMKSMKRRRN